MKTLERVVAMCADLTYAAEIPLSEPSGSCFVLISGPRTNQGFVSVIRKYLSIRRLANRLVFYGGLSAQMTDTNAFRLAKPFIYSTYAKCRGRVPQDP